MSWWSTASLTWPSSTKGKSLLEAIRLNFETFFRPACCYIILWSCHDAIVNHPGSAYRATRRSSRDSANNLRIIKLDDPRRPRARQDIFPEAQSLYWTDFPSMQLMDRPSKGQPLGSVSLTVQASKLASSSGLGNIINS